VIVLPEPRMSEALPLADALRRRRSVRSYGSRPLSLGELSQLLWAAQGITGSGGARTAPSAGATYPLEIYVAAGAVDELVPGVLHYRPAEHALDELSAGDVRAGLAGACFGQDWLAAAPASLVVTAVLARTRREYGRRADRYVHLEAGHAAQNVHLAAAALGLGTVVVGAFEDTRVKRVLGIETDAVPLVVMPVGA
jgi:SagB-type dehydrogenase family enzyme